MFEGEKTFVFSVGLIFFGLASVGLFGLLLMAAGAYWHGAGGIYYRWLGPPLFGGVVFLLIGLCMMIPGVKRKE